MPELVRFDKEDRYIKDFIKLAQHLYSSSDNMEDPGSIREILEERHPLSKYFKTAKFLVYDEGQVKGRFVITSYEGDDTAYIGFVEIVNDKDIAKFLFDSAYDYCKAEGFERMEGPVDASFWIKYRLKINKFEDPYTGEPYNKDYYFDLYKENGFEVKEHYVSNAFKAADTGYENEKFENRYKEFIANGYEIRSPREDEMDEVIDIIYDMVSSLYSDFPIYKEVGKADFHEVFSSFKKIMNLSMTKIAFYQGKPAGFYVSVPDYGNIVYHTNNPVNIMKILKLKKNPKRYVMLYMGVYPEHQGLGKAITYAVIKELMATGLPSIGSLIRDGKVNQKYASEMVEDVYEYVLLQRNIG
ncbi:MAG: hypothetical protein J6X33_04490 [Clostridiales bacterium]|nr:hypothetical protein [Clostridiales bacterium]